MKRLGIIVPSTNSVAEADFQRRAGEFDNLSVHTSRMFIDATTAEAERRMITDFLPDAIRDLATVKPHVVVFSCTSAAAVVGKAGEDDLIVQIGERTGAVAISTNRSVHQSLRELATRRLAVLTPYIRELTDKIEEGITSTGIDVVHAAGMNIIDPFGLAEVTPGDIIAFAERELDGKQFDTIFVSCTNLRAFEARELLIERFGTPVVTSNQAASDAVLRALGLLDDPR